MQKTPILKIDDLSVSFQMERGLSRAVRGVSLELFKGETLAIVGESGSGKSVTTRAVMGLLAANARVLSGSILFEGKDLLKSSERELCRVRGSKIAMIFQDPFSSLNPIVRIGKQITEVMFIKHRQKRRLNKSEPPLTKKQG